MSQKQANKILLADDSHTVLELLKAALEGEGMQVVTASNGVEAIEKLYWELPDLVILDVELPMMKGYQVCRFLKNNPETRHIPVIILSVRKAEEDISWGADCGADAYFIKCSESSGLKQLLISLKVKISELLDKKEPFTRRASRIRPEEVIFQVNDLLDEQLRKARILGNRLQLLFSLSSRLLSFPRLEELYQEIMESSLRLLGADAGSLMLLDRDTGQLKIVSSFGLAAKLAQGVSVPLGEGIAGWVAQKKSPLLLAGDLQSDPRFAHLKTRGNIKSSLCVPLLVKGELIGVLNLNILREEKKFESPDLEFASTLANYLAAIMERTRLYGELRDTLQRLKRTQAELIHSEKLATLGRFAAGIAHEINNPLAIISTEAQIALKKEGLDKKLRESLVTIFDQCGRISRITGRLLSFARPQKPQPQLVNIKEALEETLKLSQGLLSFEKVNVLVDLGNLLPRVKANLHQLQEVFLNLIVNAYQAMPQGGTLSIEAKLKDKCLEVRFADTGRGIAPQDIPRVFEPFFTTKEKGTGLGLFVSDQIVRSLGGNIKLETQPGKGTVFIVELPLEKTPS
jgi:signal transduction histidine kinase/DNA-binding response OmpR family regulator